jgi:hypothetical protein
MTAVSGESSSPDVPAVQGESSAGIGVRGFTSAPGGLGVSGEAATGHGVHGKSTSGRGVAGFSDSFQGVYGHSDSQAGVAGESKTFHAVYGSTHDVNSAGVYGTNDTAGRGVIGTSDSGQGVYGHSTQGAGVLGESQDFDGVIGTSHNVAHAGVSGHNPGGLAGYFDGNVVVTGDIVLTNAADLAEEFDVQEAELAEPGTVMVMGPHGRLEACTRAYDKRVIGVVSGAASYRPGIVLDKRTDLPGRQPIALMGKVFTKVDAGHGKVDVGDVLTTSPTAGHAMRADSIAEAFGTVIGKAMQPLDQGCGLIAVLVALQ